MAHRVINPFLFYRYRYRLSFWIYLVHHPYSLDCASYSPLLHHSCSQFCAAITIPIMTIFSTLVEHTFSRFCDATTIPSVPFYTQVHPPCILSIASIVLPLASLLCQSAALVQPSSTAVSTCFPATALSLAAAPLTQSWPRSSQLVPN
jgi:hypothetical protein